MKLSALQIIAVTFALVNSSGCIHPKIGLHRGKLLDPMMDPSKSSGFYSSFISEPTMLHENGSGLGGGGSGGSCPTCGG